MKLTYFVVFLTSNDWKLSYKSWIVLKFYSMCPINSATLYMSFGTFRSTRSIFQKTAFDRYHKKYIDIDIDIYLGNYHDSFFSPLYLLVVRVFVPILLPFMYFFYVFDTNMTVNFKLFWTIVVTRIIKLVICECNPGAFFLTLIWLLSSVTYLLNSLFSFLLPFYIFGLFEAVFLFTSFIIYFLCIYLSIFYYSLQMVL